MLFSVHFAPRSTSQKRPAGNTNAGAFGTQRHEAVPPVSLSNIRTTESCQGIRRQSGPAFGTMTFQRS